MTIITDLQQWFVQEFPEITFRFEEPLSRHTSFRIGGPAEIMVFPKDREQLAAVLKRVVLLDRKPVILGAGTNILAPDEGLRGIVICTKDALCGMHRLNDTDIYIASGISMARAASFAASLGLAGMEFAHGIPGSIGGGIYMNAGAYGGELADICKSVDIMRPDGTVVTVPTEQMGFSYRKSSIEGSDNIVLGAVFTLKPDAAEEIKARMQDLQQRRRASQPLDYPSAGSAFKRPVGGYAAALIDQAGLKGYRVGDAAVSEKHAGFVINLGNATAEDVKLLLQQVADIVYEKSGIRLEPEIRIWQ